MRAYEIEGWLEKKLRRKEWDRGRYAEYSDHLHLWIRDIGQTYDYLSHLFMKDDWEVFEEPKKVTLFRHTYKDNRDSINQTEWTSDSWENYAIKQGFGWYFYKTETKEIEL